MPEGRTARELAAFREMWRATIAPCATPRCAAVGWYRYPPDVGEPRCQGCGSVLRVDWALRSEPAVTPCDEAARPGAG